MAWEVRERGDKLFDPCGEPVDLVGADVDLVEEQLGEIGVVVIETAVERLDHRPRRYDSSTTRSTPKATRSTPRAKIDFVVESTSYTLDVRRPSIDGWGRRIQIIPDALATSIAAAHAKIRSSSSLSISSTSLLICFKGYLPVSAGMETKTTV